MKLFPPSPWLPLSLDYSLSNAHTYPRNGCLQRAAGMSCPLPRWEQALHQMWVCISCRYVCDWKQVEVSNSSDKSPPQKKRLASVSHGSCQPETTQRCLNHIIRVLPPLFINVAHLRFCLATVRAKGGSASEDIQRDSRHHHTVSRQWGTVSEVQMRCWRQIR